MQQSFEFDEAKSRANRQKHGIDFVEAQDLWLDGTYSASPPVRSQRRASSSWDC